MIITIGICGIIALALAIAWGKILDDPEYKSDFHYCYNCKRGWCDCVPGCEGCIRRKDNGR